MEEVKKPEESRELYSLFSLRDIQSESIAKLSEALASAQGEMETASKDSSNPFFGSKYADLTSIIGASRPALSKNGLSVVQTTMTTVSGSIILITQVTHASGEYMRGFYPIRPLKQVKDRTGAQTIILDNTPQGFGSALSYARRYAYASMIGVTQEDDDGNAASGRSTK